tara:strand:+ start:323 stop:547 length:225 start_codon:yes stop_codon:yes gene_type:complete
MHNLINPLKTEQSSEFAYYLCHQLFKKSLTPRANAHYQEREKRQRARVNIDQPTSMKGPVTQAPYTLPKRNLPK